MNDDKPTWESFLAWASVGVALAISALGAMTIGVWVLPFALIGLISIYKRANRRGGVGLISGAGIPILYIAYLNRNGPGDICTPFGLGGQQCTQEYSWWPFVLVGTILIALGVVMFLRIRSGSGMSNNFKGVLVAILVVGVLIFGLLASPSTHQ